MRCVLFHYQSTICFLTRATQLYLASLPAPSASSPEPRSIRYFWVRSGLVQKLALSFIFHFTMFDSSHWPWVLVGNVGKSERLTVAARFPSTRRDGIFTRRVDLQQRHRAPNKPRRIHSVTTQLTSRLTVLACASELAGRPKQLTTCLTSECATCENLNIWSTSFANPNIGDMSMASETHRTDNSSIQTIQSRRFD